jgi:DNA-binding response OmpR family regulator
LGASSPSHEGSRIGLARLRELAFTAVRSEAFVKEVERWAADAVALEPQGPEHVHAPRFDATVRILVAESNLDMREPISPALGDRWSVMTVGDGDAALAAARDWQPDLVLTDVFMPGLSGFGLLSELRKDVRTRSCAVIMLSARAEEESRIDGLEAGANDYLVGPLSARELVARVSTQVELARLRKVADAERARLFSFLMQLPVAIAACEGPNHLITLKNPLFDALTCGQLKIGDPLCNISLSRIALDVPRKSPVAVLDRVYTSGEAAVWREQRVSIESDDGGCDEHLYDVALQPLHDAHGAVTGIVAAAYEVGARRSTRPRREARRRRELIAVVARERVEEFEPATLSTRKGGVDAPAHAPRPDPVAIAARDLQPPSPWRTAAPVAKVGVASAPEATRLERQKRDGEPWRVLVVDDDHDAAELLEEALVELGYRVEVAYDGPSALRLVHTFQPDTALVDVGMPDMDGFEVAQRLRDAEEVSGALRLVAITGYGRASDRMRSREAGFDLHLVKPIRLDELSAAVVGVGGGVGARSGQGPELAIDHHGG